MAVVVPEVTPNERKCSYECKEDVDRLVKVNLKY